MTGESRNALAARLLDQGLRTDEHPLIVFRQGAAGRHSPAVAGTRLYVFQVLQTLWASEHDIGEAARYLGISDQQVRAGVDYYADFKDEVDTEMAEEADFAARERERAGRRREVLGEAAAR